MDKKVLKKVTELEEVAGEAKIVLPPDAELPPDPNKPVTE